MKNKTQLERYKKLLSYIDENFKEDINIEKVEAICHYSYRNINRIFEAIHNETIGKYIKRLRLEKAAQYLKYTYADVSDIAYDVGFEDRAAFSKAFKNKYKVSPSAFRNNNEAIRETLQQSMLPDDDTERETLQYEIEYLPDFEYLFLEYRGDYEDEAAVNKAMESLATYGITKQLVSKESIFMTEFLDDNEISDTLNFRYNLALILEQPLTFKPEGFFRTRSHKRQKYAKFMYKGTFEKGVEFYKSIYAFWILDVALELVDLPTLEFYPNHHENLPEDELITEIYIPVR
ncbi:GyrI-like domain-containing protein [Winogradskyella sp. 3972H.M.0a.05]|uniref:AraC family transcriptional regulator n=1 Tax=Winogradskyella sp. 3972H.M.0a.05 TaxID=2950277 RepID=UPI00339165E8